MAACCGVRGAYKDADGDPEQGAAQYLADSVGSRDLSRENT